MSFLKNIAVTFSSRILILLLGIISNIIIAREVGAEGIGTYTTIVTTSSILVMLLGGGLNWSNTYLVGKNKSYLNDVFFNSLSFSILVSIVLITLYLTKISEIIANTLQVNNNIIPAILISIPLTLIWNNNQAITLGLQEIKKYNVISIINIASLVLFNLIFLHIFDLKFKGVLISWILSIIITIISSIYFISSNVEFKYTVNPLLFIESIKLGIKAAILNMIGYLLLRSDIYMIGYFIGVEAVGIYSAAVFISELVSKAPSMIGTLLFPIVSANENKEVQNITAKLCRSSIFIGTILCLFLSILGKSLILISFGSNFITSYYSLLYLIPGMISLSGSVILSNYFSGKGYPRYMISISVISLIINVLLNILLIPKYGIIGAAISTSISYIANLLLITTYFVKDTNISAKSTLIINMDDIKNYIQIIKINTQILNREFEHFCKRYAYHKYK